MVTFGPTFSTVPEMSQPTVNGGSPSSLIAPARTAASTGLMPAALMRTSNSPLPGSGTGRSASSRTSGSPRVFWTIAFMSSSGCGYSSDAGRKSFGI